MISTLAALVLATQAGPQMGIYDLGGHKTPATLPSWRYESSHETAKGPDGLIYHRQGDRLVGKSRAGGNWDELPALLAAAQPTPLLTWNLDFFVVADVESASFTELGFLAYQRSPLNDDAIRQVRKEIALFCEMVRAYTGGKVVIKPRYEAETEVISVPQGQMVESVLGPQVKGRMRSDTHSTIVVTSEAGFGVRESQIAGIPTSYMPAWSRLDTARPGRLSRLLLSVWKRQVMTVLSGLGFGFDASSGYNAAPAGSVGQLEFINDPADVLTPAVCQSLAGRTPKPTVAFDPATAKTWASVETEPWMSLPAIQSTTIEGAREVGVAYASITGKLNPTARVLGYRPYAGDILVAFKDAPAMAASTLAFTAPSPGQPLPELPFNAGQAEKLPVSGAFQMQTVVDTDRGAVGELRETPGARASWVRLLNSGSIEATPYLEAWVKPRVAQTALDLVVETSDGEHRMRLFGRTYSSKPTKTIALAQSNEWELMTIDLRAVAGPQGTIRAIYLASPPDAFFWSNSRPGVQLFIDDLKLSATRTTEPRAITAIAAPIQLADSADPFGRAAWAQQKGDDAAILAKLLESDDLSALNAFSKVTVCDAGNRAALWKLARGLSHRHVEKAIQLIAMAGDARDLADLRNIIKIGPFDHMKRAAVNALADSSHDRSFLADVSVLLVSRSWRSRLAAALAAAKVKGNVAKIVAMSFVNDTEPAVRIGVINAADLGVPEVLSRLESMLDPVAEPSEYVRAHVIARLRAKKPEACTKAEAALSPLGKTFLAEIAAVPSLSRATPGHED